MELKWDVEAVKILAVLPDKTGARACLNAARTAAEAFKRPSIVALHVRVDPVHEILPTEEMLTQDQRRALETEAFEEGIYLRDIYLSWAAEIDSKIQNKWLETEGSEEEEVRKHGSEAILNVVANVIPGRHGHARVAFHTALFETGKPLLLVPRQYECSLFRRVLVGWKDQTPSRHALQSALPWLRRAERVLLVQVGGEGSNELEWASAKLKHDGVFAFTRNVPRHRELSVGSQILQEAEAFQADLLVTGAFRRGEFLEWIFGGVTEALLEEATIPILMHH